MNLLLIFFFWQVENENHCDFVKLRDLLLSTNMEDLKDQTHTQHYECYRSNRLQKLGFSDTGPDNRPVRWVQTWLVGQRDGSVVGSAVIKNLGSTPSIHMVTGDHLHTHTFQSEHL